MQYNGYFTAKEGVLHSSCKLNEMLHNAVDSYWQQFSWSRAHPNVTDDRRELGDQIWASYGR